MATVEMKICDTSWTDSRLRPLIYMNADVVLICFSVDRRYSLQFIANDLAEEVRRCCGPGIPVILVGCKTDARDNPYRREDNRNEGWGRMITTEEGEGAAQRISAAHYFEISAKLGQGLEELFKCAAKEGVRYHLASLSKRKK
ncbi:GTP-binding protein [Coprinopsis cinerea okayama7|uniref:GTP-binding protein n=1 Tax=Coprinopsis cinerea (strain Okayama-7 / 130 / ATCC MYA-4618 / FGSC 9003) TaxID=240176 RepID=D6RNZ3_COPC7|nr:GTP-binding protein [Coprinopsis cinerea okayama7\|eukprot:XP_002910763.1 GTP-binding protein [Coprinopsis cinerea okayama7\